MVEKVIGKITKINPKGWGFITSEEIKFTKFFFHWTALSQRSMRFPNLKTGMKVKFIPINLDEPPPAKVDKIYNEEAVDEKVKGPRAIQIEILPETIPGELTVPEINFESNKQ